MKKQYFETSEADQGHNTHSACTHHLSFRHSGSSKLLRLMNKEALDQLEPGMNMGVFPFGYESAGYRQSNEK